MITDVAYKSLPRLDPPATLVLRGFRAKGNGREWRTDMLVAKLQSFFRKKRNQRLVELVNHLSLQKNRPITVLDVGGRAEFWKTVDVKNIEKITITNIDPADIVVDPNASWIEGEYANALDLSSFKTRGFDLVVSNSVIEHLQTWANMKVCAQELRSVADAGFIQTPSFWFPVEQHFMIPFFHWLPNPLRVILLPILPRRGYEDVPNVDIARAYIEEINLLTKPEFQFLFPKAQIFRETLIGLTKSYTAVWGHDDAAKQ